MIHQNKFHGICKLQLQRNIIQNHPPTYTGEDKSNSNLGEKQKKKLLCIKLLL